MSLHPQAIPAIPTETARVARAVFPKGNLYMHLKDELGAIYEDHCFADLFPERGQPAACPWRLALVTIMQYVEGLSDRQAADAVRSRIDWKYALCLELTDVGFHHSILSEFRGRLVGGGAEERLLDLLLEKCQANAWIKVKGRQRTDSTYVLGRIRAVNRLVCVAETLRAALNSLALIAPDWLPEHSEPDWVDRYGKRIEDSRLPSSKEKREEYAQQVGRDGFALLSALYEQDASAWLVRLPAVDVLRRVWLQQYYIQQDKVQWRGEKEGIPAAVMLINSPYDPEARYARKSTTSWVGYKVHVSETCEDGLPHLITHVATAPGPTADGDATDQIHESLQNKDLLPATHIVDTGYLDAKLLLSSQQTYGVDLLGPARTDQKWQARAKQGFAAENFHIDWQAQQVTCPEGKVSMSWSEAIDNQRQEVVKIKFSQKDCKLCTSRPKCTRARRRTITVREPAQHQALLAARAREKTIAFKDEYARRAGVEGTISQGVRAYGLRRARYIGIAKTHLQHVLTATAINFTRINNWLLGIPLEKTRISAFEKLMQPLMV